MAKFDIDAYEVTSDSTLEQEIVYFGTKLSDRTEAKVIRDGKGRGKMTVNEMVNSILNDPMTDAILHLSGKDKGKAKSLNTQKKDDGYKAFAKTPRALRSQLDNTFFFVTEAANFKATIYAAYEVDDSGYVVFVKGNPKAKKVASGSESGKGKTNVDADTLFKSIQTRFNELRNDDTVTIETIATVRDVMVKVLGDCEVAKNLPEVSGTV